MPLKGFSVWKQWPRETFHCISAQKPMQLNSKQPRDHFQLVAELDQVVCRYWFLHIW